MVRKGSPLDRRRMPFFRLCLSYTCGILIGFYVELPFVNVVVLGGIVGVLVMLVLCLEIINKRFNHGIIPYIVLLIFIFLGMFGIMVGQSKYQPTYFGRSNLPLLSGIITDEPLYREKTIRFPVRVDYGLNNGHTERAVGALMITVWRDTIDGNYQYGDRIVFQNNSTEIPPAWNPRQFDYRLYLEKKQIYRQALLQRTQVEVVGHGEGKVVTDFALRIRAHLMAKFHRFVGDRTTFQISSALIFGYRTAMSTDVLEAFTNTGTIHVLSVSGLHVGIVFMLLNYLLRFMDRWTYGKLFRLAFTLCCIWAYVILTGMAPAILRAGIMITFFLVARAFEKKQNNLNTLFASALFILIFDPTTLFDMGFQLSYLAVLGLFTLYPLMLQTVPVPQNKVARQVCQMVFISLAAQLFTAPLALYYFHQFPNLFLLGNLFIALPSTVIMYVGMALAFSPIEEVSTLLGLILHQLVQFMFVGLQWIDRLPYAVTKGIHFTGWQVVVFSSAIWLLYLVWLGRQKKLLPILCLALILLAVGGTWHAVRDIDLRTVRIYNTQRNLNMAIIDRGKVTLFSTLDSLTHPQLRFHIWRDLEYYASDLAAIRFIAISDSLNSGTLIRGGGATVLIVEKGLPREAIGAPDMLIWRDKHVQRLRDIPEKWKRTMIIFDGTHTAVGLQALQTTADSLGLSYYVLKDNFAYFWDKNK